VNGPPDPVWLAAENLLSCVEEALSKYDAPACRTFIAPGAAPAWDVCCDCGAGDGMAWVQIAEVFPSDNFPAVQGAGMRCNYAENGVRFNIAVIRCAAVLDDQGRPPSSERLTADARKVQRDRAIINEAIRCCYLSDADPGSFVIGTFTPLGPQGGCVGGTTSLQIATPSCRCPAPPPPTGFGLDAFGTSEFGAPQ
jgi:hypothetical protein